MKHLRKYLPILVIVSLSISAWIFNLSHYFSLEKLKENQRILELFIEQNLALSILIYCSIYIIIVGLSIPLATFMTLTGGFLLGQWVGTTAAVISSTIGASILFLSAKMVSTDLVSQKSRSWAQKMQKGFQEHAFSYLLTLRLMPLFPFVVINIASAFFQIPLRIFFFGTLLGIIPATFIYTSLGVALRGVIQKPDFTFSTILEPKILFALTGLGILSLLPVLYKHFKQKKS